MKICFSKQLDLERKILPEKMKYSLKMAVFWDVAPCNLVKIGRRFRDAFWIHHQGESPLNLWIPEMSVSFYEITRRNISEDSHLHIRRRENLKSHWSTAMKRFKRRLNYFQSYALLGAGEHCFGLCLHLVWISSNFSEFVQCNLRHFSIIYVVNVDGMNTERQGQMVSCSASYSGDPDFTSRSEDLSWLRFVVVFLSSPDIYRDSTSN
jgi:hypothetical protein